MAQPRVLTAEMRLNETFDTVAELYDRARPRYPAALFEDLAALTGAAPGTRVLEIAPGTGIATVELARRGFRVTAVEMGEQLAAVARRNVQAFSDATVEVSRFEDWPIPSGEFDLVCCATAFSWLDPGTRMHRCAAALRPGGHLAIWDTHHVAGGTGQFFVDVQSCYEHWDPATEPGIRLERAEDVVPRTYGLESHPSFDLVAIRDYQFDVRYTTASYLDVLHTYSGHIALPAASAEGLYDCIRSLLDGRYGGKIEKRYLVQLVLARRR